MAADTPSSATPGTIRPDISAPHGSSAERIALVTTSGAHFLHDGIADSLYVFLPFWAQAFGLNYASVGALKTAYSAAMALFQMPAGILAERTSERSLLVGGTLLAGTAFAAMALAGGFSSLFLAILLVGIGSAVQHPLASSIIARSYPAAQRRSALGIYNFSGDVGKMVVAFGIASAAGLIGWQAAAVGYGAMVVVGGALLLLVLHRYSLGQSRASPNETGERAAVGPPAKGLQLVDARGFTLLSCIQAIDSGGRTGALTLLPFVLVQKGASPATVGLSLALIFAGGAIGKLACGLLANRVGILRTVMLTEMATAVILLTVLVVPLAAAMAFMPLLGIALNGTSSVLYGTVADFVHPDRQARAFGLFYTIGSAAGGSAPLAFGVLGDGIGLQSAMTVLAAVLLTTLPMAVLLRPHLAGRYD